MYGKRKVWLRAVEGTENGGGSASSVPPESSGGNSSDEESHNNEESNTPDWEALYKESQQEVDKWKSHSRKWEERAKANYQSGSAPDSSEIRERLAQVEQDLQSARAEADAAKAEQTKLSIGAEFGLPKADIDLYLRGSEDDMRKQAQGLADRMAQEPTPENSFQGRGGQGSSKTTAVSWAQELLGKNK